MGRVDPEVVTSNNVHGGQASKVDVTFVAPMGCECQDPVTYEGDLDALGANPPTACPWPAAATEETQTSFYVPTKFVTAVKSVTVTVHGPTESRKTTFTVYPPL